ncbi:MAG: hypothetical protein ACLQGJ_09825 [Candidatus Dormibacteria bacterium]
MARRLIYVGIEDDVADLAGKVQAGNGGDEVALAVPPGAQAFQTPLNLRLLRSVAAKRGLTVAVVSPDPRIQELGRGAGLAAYSSVAAYEGGVPVEVRRAGQPPFRGLDTTPRPQAPFLPRPTASVETGGLGAVPAPAGPRPVGPAATDGPPAVWDGMAWAPPGPPPVTARSPWDPVPPPAPPAPASPGPVLPAPPPAPPPRPGNPWSSAPTSAARDEPAPPWASIRAAAALGTAPAAAVVEIAPLPPSAPPAPPAPPGRTPAPSRKPSPPPGRGRAHLHPLLRNRTAITFTLIALAVIGLVAFLVLSPSAIVTVTVAEQPLTVNPTIQGTVSASQAGQGNYILSKVITDSASQTFQANPTGTQAVAAVAATGEVDLTAVNNSIGYCIPPYPLTFQTASGIQFLASNSDGIEVLALGESPPPGDQCNLPTGFAINTLAVTAVTPGTAGNVAADAINGWDPSFCTGTTDYCTDITVYNPAATTGGVAAATQTIASAADVQSWQQQLNQVENQLTAKADSDLATRAAGERPAIDPSGDGRSVTFLVTPSTFSTVTAGTVMSPTTVTVAMSAQETVFNPASIQTVVVNDLKASPNLPSGDALIPSQLSLSNEQVIQAGSDGTFALSVTGTDYYHPPSVSFGQLRNQLTGHNPSDVAAIIGQQIPNVQHVTVSESPLQLFFMPFFSSHIQIVETFATPSGSSSSSTG